MKVLDVKLDESPTDNDVREMAELRIRNLLCFRELQALNDTGKFENLHPFLIHRQELNILKILWEKDRADFIREYQNCKVNIRRYKSKLNRKDISEADFEKYTLLLMKHQERESIFNEIINNEPNNNRL